MMRNNKKTAFLLGKEPFLGGILSKLGIKSFFDASKDIVPPKLCDLVQSTNIGMQ